MLEKGEAAANQSGRQEMLLNVINRYLRPRLIASAGKRSRWSGQEPARIALRQFRGGYPSVVTALRGWITPVGVQVILVE